MARVSMKDVAAKAGVSTKTVSNVVRGWPYVAPETRGRVQQALDELGYRMNRSAQMLKSGRSQIITLVVPWLDSPYFSELTTMVIREAEALGYSVIIEQTNGDPDRERSALSGPAGQLTDGLIYSPMALGATEIRATLIGGLPVVLLGERVPSGVSDQVAIDNVDAARQVTRHLASIGRRRIAMIGSPAPTLSERSAGMRLEGYLHALGEAGLTAPPELQKPVVKFTRAEGARAMDELLSSPEPPDAVFCASDLLAMGAMYSARLRGVGVPVDVAIAGFDDIEDGRYSNPTLTTVRPDKTEIAQASVKFLVDRIALDGASLRDIPPRRATPRHELVVRGSTLV